ncbi:19964_t:CDS:2, partial [Funneliformis geosporum]
ITDINKDLLIDNIMGSLSSDNTSALVSQHNDPPFNSEQNEISWKKEENVINEDKENLIVKYNPNLKTCEDITDINKDLLIDNIMGSLSSDNTSALVSQQNDPPFNNLLVENIMGSLASNNTSAHVNQHNDPPFSNEIKRNKISWKKEDKENLFVKCNPNLKTCEDIRDINIDLLVKNIMESLASNNTSAHMNQHNDPPFNIRDINIDLLVENIMESLASNNTSTLVDPPFNNEIKSNKIYWKKDEIEILLAFLITNKEMIKQLNSRGSMANKVKKVLWNCASTQLEGKYSAAQCEIKWKNIKMDFKKNPIYKYKTKVEVIIGIRSRLVQKEYFDNLYSAYSKQFIINY